jgi:hypothetical protein
MEEGRVKDETIRRLLRMRISWATTVVVLIGNETHSRRWVNWEIEEAKRQGKRIVGVYAYGGTDAQKPEALERYASTIVAWNADSIVDAIEGADNRFENSDGTARQPVHPSTTRVC